LKSMEKPIARLDLRELRRRLRRIGSWRKSRFPERVRLRLRIVSWYGRRHVEEICRFFQVSRSWFYRLLSTFLGEGLAGFMKGPGRPRGSTVPRRVVQEIRRVRMANPRIGSRRLRWLLGLGPHHTTIHRVLQVLGLVRKRPYKRRVWKRFRAEEPDQRWQVDIAETSLDGRRLYKITLVDDHSNYRLASHLSLRATGRVVEKVLSEAIGRYSVPEELLSDNGAQFRGRKGGETEEVGRLCREHGIRQVFTSPNHPQTIGKAEHAHRDDKMEFFDLIEFRTIGEGQRKIDLFDVWQNGCPNRGLDGQSPAEAYGRPISHQRCIEAFYQLYLNEAPPRT